jgi:hypothetical protein
MSDGPEPEAWVDAELARLQLVQNDQNMATMARVVAGLVIARTEHARAWRKLRADADRHEEELALMRRAISETRRGVLALHERVAKLDPDVAEAWANTVGDEVDELEERVAVIERALPFIERRIGLHRKASAWNQSGPATATAGWEPPTTPPPMGEPA